MIALQFAEARDKHVLTFEDRSMVCAFILSQVVEITEGNSRPTHAVVTAINYDSGEVTIEKWPSDVVKGTVTVNWWKLAAVVLIVIATIIIEVL